MCHEVDLNDRLALHPASLSPADLLLTKLQIVELNDKEIVDAIALILQHDVGSDDAKDEIALPRLQHVTSRDWGWITTFTDNLGLVKTAAAERLGADDAQLVLQRLETIATALQTAPKTARWKMRARLGRLITWYELPEEVGCRA
jgi:hypothetical protein